MQQIVNGGGADELYHYLWGKDPFNMDPWDMKKHTLPAVLDFKELARAALDPNAITDFSTEDGRDGWVDLRKHATEQAHPPGWMSPWQNHEEGVLPDFYGYRLQDLLKPEYFEAVTQQSKEAAVNTSQWVDMTSGKDPNLYLAGATNTNMKEAGRSLTNVITFGDMANTKEERIKRLDAIIKKQMEAQNKQEAEDALEQAKKDHIDTIAQLKTSLEVAGAAARVAEMQKVVDNWGGAAEDVQAEGGLPEGYHYEDYLIYSDATGKPVGTGSRAGTLGAMWAEINAKAPEVKAKKVKVLAKKVVKEPEDTGKWVKPYTGPYGEKGLSKTVKDRLKDRLYGGRKEKIGGDVQDRKEFISAYRLLPEPTPTEPEPTKPGAPYMPIVDTLQGMTPFQQYMLEEHGERVSQLDVHREDYPYLSFTRTGEVALYGDEALHEKLPLPDNIRAVQSQNGVVHTVFDPAVHMPKFIGTHEVHMPVSEPTPQQSVLAS